MALWEQILVGVLALLVLLWFLPGVGAAMKQSREAQSKDWRGALLPVAMVVLFVLLLISMVRG